MRVSGAISACAAALAAMVMGAPPASAQFVASDGQIPAGYCVTDIATRAAVDNTVFPIYSSDLQDSTGQQVGYPLNHWDISSGTGSDGSKGGGYMNMSVKIGRIAEGECLTDARLLFATSGLPPTPSSNVNDNPWTDRGGWPSRHFWQPTGHGKATGIIFQQKMTPSSKNVLTGITLLYNGPCTPICLGTWKPESGETYYQLAIAKSPYTPALGPQVQAMSGRWVRLSTCVGCSKLSYTLTVGVTSGSTAISSKETQKTLAASIGYAFSSGNVIPSNTVSASLTGTIGETVRSEIQQSFSKTTQESSEQECPAGKTTVYQWQTSIVLSTGISGVAAAGKYVCTSVVPTAANLTDYNWSPDS